MRKQGPEGDATSSSLHSKDTEELDLNSIS